MNFYIGEAIVKKLTTERIEELKRLIPEDYQLLLEYEREEAILNSENPSEEDLAWLEQREEEDQRRDEEETRKLELMYQEREKKANLLASAKAAAGSPRQYSGAVAKSIEAANLRKAAMEEKKASNTSGTPASDLKSKSEATTESAAKPGESSSLLSILLQKAPTTTTAQMDENNAKIKEQTNTIQDIQTLEPGKAEENKVNGKKNITAYQMH